MVRVPIQDGKDSEVFLEDRIHFRAIENSLFRVFTEKPTENPGALVAQALDEDGLIECLRSPVDRPRDTT